MKIDGACSSQFCLVQHRIGYRWVAKPPVKSIIADLSTQLQGKRRGLLFRVSLGYAQGWLPAQLQTTRQK